ncbi:hypothetical protein CALVIDRAFT_387418 [Calocera viscosa TUFC12733]|uniref:Uncharacterized protein n=1 Tax=Calocera viscosa (strain TUFC12733) TaxID=1330018 RepID=A0A167GLD9_CALVF|nr:hypothetical protein CALVIDRAFT_387418 [Calocera viscosa TUFC12733]
MLRERRSRVRMGGAIVYCAFQYFMTKFRLVLYLLPGILIVYAQIRETMPGNEDIPSGAESIHGHENRVV